MPGMRVPVVAACRRFVAENVEEVRKRKIGRKERKRRKQERTSTRRESKKGGRKKKRKRSKRGKRSRRNKRSKSGKRNGTTTRSTLSCCSRQNQKDDEQATDDADWSADESEPSQKRPKVESSQQEATVAAAAALLAETLKVELSKALERVKDLEAENTILSLKLQLAEALASKC